MSSVIENRGSHQVQNRAWEPNGNKLPRVS